LLEIGGIMCASWEIRLASFETRSFADHLRADRRRLDQRVLKGFVRFRRQRIATMRAMRERHFDPATDRLKLVGIIGIPAVFVGIRSSTSEVERLAECQAGPRATDCD
jgi:hypothetical protein